eukprot:13422746-Ditylum_brightwellii.AAC.1
MTLKQWLQTTKELWIVSDGWVKEDLDYFGFVVATGSVILLKDNSQSQGNPRQMESLRAEGSGGLAAFQFLTQYIQYYNIKSRKDLLLYFCDNNTLLGV